MYSHAVLLHGKSGYGTLAIALHVTSYLVCKNKMAYGPCGKCSSCIKSLKWIHPDIHYSFPVVKKGSDLRKNTSSVDYLKDWREALNSNPYMTLGEWILKIADSSAKPDINVLECNQIIRQLGLQSFEEGAKVQIIWMAEYLGNNANRLLKLIEEPPENTFIIMICEDLELMLNTIKSRCQVIRIPRISDEAMASYLTEFYELDSESAMRLAFLSEGDFSEAMGHLAVDSKDMLNIAIEFLTISKSNNLISIRDWVDNFNKYNAQEKNGILSYTLKILREVLHYKILGSNSVRFSEEDFSKFRQTGLIEALNTYTIEAIHEIVSEALYLLGRNAHTKVLMFNSCLEIEEAFNNNVS